MGVDFSISVEPRQPATTDITDDEIERNYRENVPSGEPPLAAIREHVIRAIALVRNTAPDPIAPLHDRFVNQYGRYRIWFDTDLEAIAIQHRVTPLSRFQREPGGEIVSPDDYSFDSDAERDAFITEQTAKRQAELLRNGPAWDRWCDPADALRTIRVLQAAITDREALDCLALVAEILTIAERDHRRWRLLVFW